ncbi:hypothetical protein COT63_02165 [Candidatus Shapirobacteria bacterium CG09_land_8_20_14_0_10_38_17]|uniref:AI-2E family transporter n=1 Tax=Candidatus Shapirobacteria bacterium CG09_land_8_20_14_0_10_38_17 TaxID=1974884 RepID=A0A2H0WQU1_9BACT|nr:MAG: hypothetical protein COT63_02165 [Candidatus Shapirobacteria bacterium CG09_land_8_20_14_0_10_38_17]
MAPKKVEISHKTIIFIVVFLFSLWFLYFVRDIVLLFLVSFSLMLALSPAVNKLENKFHFPRFLAILVNYFFIIGLVVLAISLLAGPLFKQTGLLINQLLVLTEKMGFAEWAKGLLDNPFSQIGIVSGNIFKFTQGVFSNAVKIFSVFVINFYLILERKHLSKHLRHFLNEKNALVAEKIINRLEYEFGGWLWGELTLMIIIGVLTYLGLLILGIKYALPLAFLAGILEIFPNIGPSLAAIPGLIVGLSVSPLMGLGALAVYLVVQQLENSLITPKVMQRATGIHPIITFLALLIGFRLAGVAGAIFSLPMVLVIKVLFTDLFIPRLNL